MIAELARDHARAIGLSRGAADDVLHPPGAPPVRPPHPAGVAADVRAPGDAERFATLLDVIDARDPEALAAEAQLWRLPVTPYRADVDPADLGDVVIRRGAGPRRRTRRIVDLTAMWSGPLATQLLREAGHRVDKVESSVRPDGMRGTPALHRRLNTGKHHHDIDLRRPAAFLALVRDADLVVENFSPRVLSNLGLTYDVLAELNPGITLLSMPAFAPGTPEQGWVAYGSGIHAAAGLERRFPRPEVAYPDPLTGLLAARIASRLLDDPAWPGGHVTVAMSAAVRPLL